MYAKIINCVTGIEERLCQLEGLFIGSPAQGGRIGHTISIETLIDILLVLYDECCNSSLRREKTVSDFIEFGKCKRITDCVIYLVFVYKIYVSDICVCEDTRTSCSLQ